MKKLRLDDLTIESFPTMPAAEAGTRGTVRGREMTGNCYDSWGGTCWLSCWETCGCDTLDFC
jgi:hypothetical protein